LGGHKSAESHNQHGIKQWSYITLHSRSDNDKLLIWKQDLYRTKMVIEQKEKDAWVRGGIPMSLVYFRTYLLYNNQLAPRPPQAPRRPIAEET